MFINYFYLFVLLTPFFRFECHIIFLPVLSLGNIGGGGAFWFQWYAPQLNHVSCDNHMTAIIFSSIPWCTFDASFIYICQLTFLVKDSNSVWNIYLLRGKN